MPDNELSRELSQGNVGGVLSEPQVAHPGRKSPPNKGFVKGSKPAPNTPQKVKRPKFPNAATPNPVLKVK
jgi:hypothetical protein